MSYPMPRKYDVFGAPLRQKPQKMSARCDVFGARVRRPEVVKVKPTRDAGFREYHSMHPDPRVDQERRTRAAYGNTPWGVKPRSAIYQELPDVPIRRGLGTEFARWYLSEIQRVQEMDCWTRSEQNRLYILEKKWKRRADGLDPRYLEYGTLPGVNNRYRSKTPFDVSAAIRTLCKR